MSISRENDEANAYFQRDYYKQVMKDCPSPVNYDESQFYLTVFHIYFTRQLGRSEDEARILYIHAMCR